MVKKNCINLDKYINKLAGYSHDRLMNNIHTRLLVSYF